MQKTTCKPLDPFSIPRGTGIVKAFLGLGEDAFFWRRMPTMHRCNLKMGG